MAIEKGTDITPVKWIAHVHREDALGNQKEVLEVRVVTQGDNEFEALTQVRKILNVTSLREAGLRGVVLQKEEGDERKRVYGRMYRDGPEAKTQENIKERKRYRVSVFISPASRAPIRMHVAAGSPVEALSSAVFGYGHKTLDYSKLGPYLVEQVTSAGLFLAIKSSSWKDTWWDPKGEGAPIESYKEEEVVEVTKESFADRIAKETLAPKRFFNVIKKEKVS